MPGSTLRRFVGSAENHFGKRLRQSRKRQIDKLYALWFIKHERVAYTLEERDRGPHRPAHFQHAVPTATNTDGLGKFFLAHDFTDSVWESNKVTE